jgi:hypothetical protein
LTVFTHRDKPRNHQLALTIRNRTTAIDDSLFPRRDGLTGPNNLSKKLKFSEWRPIGVCDKAPPGVQKAQMFTREDFLVVTAPGINRDNWQKNSQVMSILQRYSAMLARQSSTTQGMTRPQVSSIQLVGAVMKLVVTPVLNKESQDGKLQLFQIEFKDAGVKKTPPWTLILVVLATLLAVLCVLLGIVLYQKYQARPHTVTNFRPTFQTRSYCDSPAEKTRYESQLEEVGEILQQKANDLFYQGRLSVKRRCLSDLAQPSVGEDRFLECYDLIKRHGMLSQIPSVDLTKIDSCRQSICDRRTADKRRPPPTSCSGI